MSRLRHLCLLGGLLLLVGATPASAQAPERPNIVVVMTDDQTAESVRVMNNVRLGLRNQGTTFRQAVTSYALCCPSRATYLTGQYSHNNGVVHNRPPFGGYTALDHTNTLPVWLQRAGYQTIHLGRWLNGYGRDNTNMAEVPPGWGEWHTMVDPSTFDMTAWTMNDNGLLSSQPEQPGEHQTDFMHRRAVELIDAAAPSPQPFFLSLSFVAPHSTRNRDPDDPPKLRTPSPPPRFRDAFRDEPLPQPPNFNERSVHDKPQVIADRTLMEPRAVAALQENYQQELESLLAVDEAVGGILGALQRQGELENTLVIYTSDNGFYHGEHRVRSEKTLPYEPGIRVPMIMRGPGVPRGENLDQLVSNIDLAPTILEASGATPTLVQDGRSLLDLAEDPTLEFGREIVLENGNGVFRVPSFRGIRNDRFTFLRHDTTGEVELYDLKEDPFQLQSLDENEAYDRVRTLLARRLRVLERCSGPACQFGQPAVKLRLRESAPSGRGRPSRVRRVQSCLSRDLRLAVYGREHGLVERAGYYVDDRRVASTRRPPFGVEVQRHRLPARRTVTVRARITTIDGRVITRDRALRTCR